jgi:uncharacterized protein
MKREYTIKRVVKGCVEAEIVLEQGAFSFLGDVDLDTAEIIIKNSPNKGLCISDKILIFNETKGSSGGALVLQTLKKTGKAPAAIISEKEADFNLTEGAILNNVPYASKLAPESFGFLKTGMKALLDTEKGLLIIIDE